jgi:hypothetical protein
MYKSLAKLWLVLFLTRFARRTSAEAKVTSTGAPEEAKSGVASRLNDAADAWVKDTRISPFQASILKGLVKASDPQILQAEETYPGADQQDQLLNALQSVS